MTDFTNHNLSDIESNLLRYSMVLRSHFRWICVLVCAAVLAAFVMSRLSPKYYESTAVILPSAPDLKGGTGLSMIGDEGGKGNKEEGGSAINLQGLLGQVSSTTDVLKSILHSRTLADSLIEQFNLKTYYGTDSMAQARAALKSETTISVNREKAFSITVESKDQRMAADLANAYVSNLDRLNRMLNVTSATRNRIFIERRLEEKRQQLVKTEEARKQFQVTNRTLLITDKARAAMQAAGSIEESILDLEVELAALQEYATSAHPMRNQINTQIRALRGQLEKLQHQEKAQMGISPRGQGGKKEFYPPMPEMPGLALEYIRLTREVKIHEAVVSILTSQYEQARIAEARDTPTVQILDPAIPAEVKSRPKTLQNMQVAAVIGLLTGIMLAFFLDFLKRIRAKAPAEVGNIYAGDTLIAGDSNGNGNKVEVHPGSPKETERLHG